MSEPATDRELFERALALVQAGRQQEGLALLRRVVEMRPDLHQAWWLIGSIAEPGSSEALDAFAQVIRRGPQNNLVRGLAEESLRQAGREVPDADVIWYEDDLQIVQFTLGSSFYQLDNDSGIPQDELFAALREFREADTSLEAYLVLERHPGLRSHVVDVVLQLETQQVMNPQLAHQAAVNRNSLVRAAEIGAIEAFAEADQTPVDDFRELVRGTKEIEPVLLETDGMSLDEVRALLARHAWIAADDATYMLLTRQAESANDEQRLGIATLRSLLEEIDRPPVAPPRGPGVDLVQRLAETVAADPDEALSQALDGEQALHDEAGLDPAVRLALARTIATIYTSRGGAHQDVELVRRGRRLLLGEASRVPPRSWEDMAFAMSIANAGIAEFEMTGDTDLLLDAAETLTASRARIGRGRSTDAQLLNPLANIESLRGVRHADLGGLRRGVAAFDAAEPLVVRSSQTWFVNRSGLVRTLLEIAWHGDPGGLDRCEQVVRALIQRFGGVPGDRVGLWELAGRVSSARHNWSDNPADLDEAVEHYRTALAYPEAASTKVYVSVLNNLCSALVRRHAARPDPRDLDEAVQCGEEALRRIDPAAPMATLVRRNLTKAYGSPAGVDNVGRLRRAADLQRQEVQILDADHPDRPIALFNLSSVLLGLARMGAPESVDLFTESEDAFTAALERFEPTTQPWEAIQIGEDVGSQFAAAGSWEAATALYQMAISGVESLVVRSAGAVAWAQTAGRVDHVVQTASYCAVRSGHPDVAVTWMERHRTRSLRRALQLTGADLDALRSAGHTDLARSYAARAEELTTVQAAQASNEFLRRRHADLSAQLDQVIDHIRGLPGFDRFAAEPEFDDILRAARTSDLVYCAITPLGSVALVVDGERQSVEPIELPDLDPLDLESHCAGYTQALGDYRSDLSDATARGRWLESLEDVRRWTDGFVFAPLRRARDGIRPVTLVFGGRLALLPVVVDDGDQAGDVNSDWRVTPSATALAAAQRTASRYTSASALVVADPGKLGADDLPWATAETHALDRFVTDRQLIQGPDATLATVRPAMADRKILHFACHGVAVPDHPLESYLDLADDDKLTVGMLSAEQGLGSSRVCVLSACDSAAIGAVEPSEIVALPSALIRLGAAAVLATQWPVRDAAAAVFAVRFYELWLGDGLDVAEAFAATRGWVRAASRREVAALVRRGVPSARAADLVSSLPARSLPFSGAEDWGAFTLTGC